MKLSRISLPAALAIGLLLSSCSLFRQTEKATPPAETATADTKATAPGKAADKPAPHTDKPDTGADTAASSAEPTAAQQAAARKLLNETATTPSTESTPTPTPTPTPTTSTTPTTPTPTGLPPVGGLRMGGIAATEEAASATSAPAPGSNQVELRGLRSPKLPDSLPMDIDGKLQGKD